MTWKEFLAIPIVIAGTAAVAGFGLLAMSIGRTWEPRNTDSLIVGFSGACIAGGVVVAGILGVLIGVPFFIRMIQAPPARQPADDWGDPEPRMLARMGRRDRMIDGDWDRLPGDAYLLQLPEQSSAGYTGPYPPLPPPWQQGGGYSGVQLDGIDGDNRFSME